MAIEIPKPAIYVGIASFTGKSSEGFFKRMCKHIVKTMGSNVGTDKSTSVSHTKGWKAFAPERYRQIRKKHPHDLCEDVKFCFFEFDKADAIKSQLEFFEKMLVSDLNLFKQLSKLFWPNGSTDVFRITASTSKGASQENKNIVIKKISEIIMSKAKIGSSETLLSEFYSELKHLGIGYRFIKALSSQANEAVELCHINDAEQPGEGVYLRLKKGKRGISVRIAGEKISGIKVSPESHSMLYDNGWGLKNFDEYYAHPIISKISGNTLENLVEVIKLRKAFGTMAINTFDE